LHVNNSISEGILKFEHLEASQVIILILTLNEDMVKIIINIYI